MTDIQALRTTISTAYYLDDTIALKQLIPYSELSTDTLRNIQHNASQLIAKIREPATATNTLNNFLTQYDLSTEEGVVLMCLAEALLRISDTYTQDLLIADKLTKADWHAHLGKSSSFFVNASTWALLLSGKIITHDNQNNLSAIFKKLAEHASKPLIRTALSQAIKILSQHFIIGATIDEAIKKAKLSEEKGYSYSYDMLGEAARTAEDARRYFHAYQTAIDALGKVANKSSALKNPGISIKLSALHPRYEFNKRETVSKEVVPQLLALAKQAKSVNINLTVDAEEARLLDLSLDIIEQVFIDPALNDWDGFGLAVQAYQKRAPFVLDWLIALARQNKRRLMVRLVKGAYWDTEIKYSQVNGLISYPVFTRKSATDVSYLACARKMITASDAIYPQFATHNAFCVAAILKMLQAANLKDFEFQHLFGMGEALYNQIIDKVSCRVYAPVGNYQTLLPYLVRRLLENGANTSFVNNLAHTNIPIENLLIDPTTKIKSLKLTSHPQIPLPQNIYGNTRENSLGIDLSDRIQLNKILQNIDKAKQNHWQAGPIINGGFITDKAGQRTQAIFSPANHKIKVGTVTLAAEKDIETALEIATTAATEWDKVNVEKRANYLEKAADLLQQRMPHFMALLIHEAGKTLPDAIGEVREAIDFCRYYAMRARIDFVPQTLSGPTGEFNQLSLHGRGTIFCISPWNFPLSIFIGQISAALVAGNTVITKPAQQTSLIATTAIKLLHEAGIPKNVLHLLLGSGTTIGAKLLADLRIKGVMLTGSTQTARVINQSLANRLGEIVPFIAETGGQNCLIADSSAHLEQLVIDVINSAFGSAGQRCSALRVLYIQSDIADNFINMLKGAMAELTVGNPAELTTDIGPLIDQDALNKLNQHFMEMQQSAKFIYQVSFNNSHQNGTYFMPCAFEISSLQQLTDETFGPFLHIIRYKSQNIDKVLQEISNSGFGLTQGIHSRITSTVESLRTQLKVGNLYVNRSMVGAVVGVQPFGGEGLSGTGPKAGGPHYLPRLTIERTYTVDITATGGNTSLLTLAD